MRNSAIAILALAAAIALAAGERKPLYAAAPARYLQAANPYSGSAEAWTVGERIYAARCAECHEEKAGKRRAPALDREDIRTAPAGALFWVLEKGELRAGMPSFAKLPDKYRWQLVAFLQERKAPPAGLR